MSKAKKKFASKFAKSKVGKNLITKTLGPSGETYMNYLGQLLTLYYSKDQSKKMISNVYKIAVKIKIMYDEVSNYIFYKRINKKLKYNNL